MADAVFNVAHTGLLVLGLVRGDWDLVARGLDDRLHQPRRAPLYPRSMELVAARAVARRAGRDDLRRGPDRAACGAPTTRRARSWRALEARCARLGGRAARVAFEARGRGGRGALSGGPPAPSTAASAARAHGRAERSAHDGTGVPSGTVRISRRRSRAVARAQPFEAARPSASGKRVPWIATRPPASAPRVWRTLKRERAAAVDRPALHPQLVRDREAAERRGEDGAPTVTSIRSTTRPDRRTVEAPRGAVDGDADSACCRARRARRRSSPCGRPAAPATSTPSQSPRRPTTR